jgi:hypothetical protein
MIILKIFKFIFLQLKKSSKGIADAEDRFVASMFKEKDKDESN